MHVVLDIKTGKVEPWAAIQTAAYSLKIQLKVDEDKLTFDEDSHTYFLNGIQLPSVTEILVAEGFINTQWYDDWSRERGKFIHLATYLDDMNELDEENLDPVIMPYLGAWRRFKKESGFVMYQLEEPICNPVYSYAGTPDRIGTFIKKTDLSRCAVELHADGKYKLVPFTDHNDINVWLAAVAVHHWKRNNLKGRN